MGTLGRAFYSVGFWIRETGQALDRLGCRLQGNNCFREQLSWHRTLMNVFDKAPVVDRGAFVAPSASVIGDVRIGRGSSIWYGCVLRDEQLFPLETPTYRNLWKGAYSRWEHYTVEVATEIVRETGYSSRRRRRRVKQATM